MSTKTVACGAGLLGLLLLGPAGVGGQDAEGGRKLPDAVFTEIVGEARQSIERALHKESALRAYYYLRSEAMLVALAADHRLTRQDGDAATAQLRDAALHLVDGLAVRDPSRQGQWRLSLATPNTTDQNAVRAELSRRSVKLVWPPEQPSADGDTRPVRYRLSSRFRHEDLTFFFGGCGGVSGHKIVRELSQLNQMKAVCGPQELKTLARLGFKVALVGELLRDFDEDSRFFQQVASAERRWQWARLTADLEQAAWQLAWSAHGGQAEPAGQAAQKLQNACKACHKHADVP